MMHVQSPPPGRVVVIVITTLAMAVLGLVHSWADSTTVSTIGESNDAVSDIHVPDGFVIEKVAGLPLVHFPVMAGFDEQGKLFVAANAGVNLPASDLYEQLPNFVKRLEDTNGDGRFDKATTFADKLSFPQGAVWHDGALYVASPPSIWKLEDTDGDGEADRRTELVAGFQSTGNAASVHGPFVGPTGRLFWCHGRKGHEVYQKDGSLVSQALGSRIWSCNPDGSDIQTFAGGGMDNPAELVFSPLGDLFGTVNLFYANPRRDAIAHWVHGGAYAHRQDQLSVLAEFKQTGDLLPHMVDLGHVAPSGIMQYRSGSFGPQYEGNLFLCEFNTHRVMRVVLEREGSTFRGEPEVFVSTTNSDVHFTDVLEDADGSLLVIDTGGWFRRGCPKSKIARPQVTGAIYRIRRKNSLRLNDPRGLRIDWATATPAELAQLLDDERFAVRDRAMEAMVQRTEGAQRGVDCEGLLLKTLDHAGVRGRLHVVWTASRIGAGRLIEKALSDSDADVRQTAAHALRVLPMLPATCQNRLVEMLGKDKPAVRRAVATTLGIASASTPHEQAPTKIVSELLSAMDRPDNDPLLEHAIIYALIEINDYETTLQGLSDPKASVRRAALIALDQMQDDRLTAQAVTPLLDSSEERLQRAAMRVITSHADWAPAVVERIDQWLDEGRLPDGRANMLRGALLAFHSDTVVQQAMADALLKPQTTEGLGLGTLLLDVIGRSDMGQFPDTWLPAVRSSLRHPSEAVRYQALLAVTSLKLTDFDEELARLSSDDLQSHELRVAALRTLIERRPRLDAKAFEFLISQLDGEVLPLLRRSAAQTLGLSRATPEQQQKLLTAVTLASAMELPALLPAFDGDVSDPIGRNLIGVLKKSPGLNSLSANQLRSLFENYSSAVQDAAKPLIRSLELALEQQSKHLADMLSQLTDGHPVRGRDVFFGKKAACSACHQIGTQGGDIGPALTTIGNSRSRRDLLEAIAFPSATIARNFEPYVVLTDNGRVTSGVIGRETADSIYLRTAERNEVRVPRKSIEEMHLSTVSIMPQGLDSTLTHEELSDLIAYLQSLKHAERKGAIE